MSLLFQPLTPVIDATLITEVISMIKSFMDLFSEFPLNVILIGTLAGVGFKIFRRARTAVGG